MALTEKTKIVDEMTLKKDIPAYIPTDKEIATRAWVYKCFDVMWENQTRGYPQFNGMTLQQYLDESRQLFNLFSIPRSDGRSNIKTLSPLNKLMAILARVAQNRPKIKATAWNKANQIDVLRGDIIDDLYNWSLDNIENENHSDIDFFFSAFDCQSDGIVIDFEGYDGNEHTRKTITEYDPETGECKWKEEIYKIEQCYSKRIRPEEFFVLNPYIRNVQKQPKVAWRTNYDKSQFDEEFGGYKNSKYVVPKDGFGEKEIQTYYGERWTSRVSEGKVEVVRIFDRMQDRMAIVANGVVLSDSPFIWENGKKKKYPFAVSTSAPFAGGEFFWGMSLGHKLRGDSAAIDTLYNLGIEQAKLAVNPPILYTPGNEIEDYALKSGKNLEVNDLNGFKELQFKSPDQSYFNFLSVMSKNIDFASVDPVSQGQNVGGTTARGQVIAEENARKLLSQFSMMMEDYELQKANLRIPNIIQFQMIPNKEFRIETTIDGQKGIREVKVIESIDKGETPDFLDLVKYRAKISGINLSRINITVDYLRNCEYSLRILPQSIYEQSKSLSQALMKEYIGTIAQLFPNIFQSASELFFAKLSETYDEDGQKYLDAVKQNIQSKNMQMLQQMGQMGIKPGQPQPAGVGGQVASQPNLNPNLTALANG